MKVFSNSCPNCGATLRIDGRRRICEYCGYQGMEPEPERTDDFYNFIVFNESVTPDDIKISIPDCNIGYIVRSGEAVAKDVPPGLHTVMITSSGMTEYRSVNVPGDGRASKIYVARNVMGISVRIDEPGTPSAYGARRGSLPSGNTLPILALVFSVIFPIAGLIIGLIDYSNTKKQGKKINSMTLASFIIVGLRLVIMIAMYMVILFTALR